MAEKGDAKSGKTDKEKQADADKGLLQSLVDSVSALTDKVANLTDRQEKTEATAERGESLMDKLFPRRKPPQAPAA